jgi:hypothetical protein
LPSLVGWGPRELTNISGLLTGTRSGKPKPAGARGLPAELELELIQTRMIQKPLLWVEVGKSACVLVGICELRLSPPARYDPQCPSLLNFLSGCLVRVLWTCRSSKDPLRDVEQVTPYQRAFLFLIITTVAIATRVLSCGRISTPSLGFTPAWRSPSTGFCHETNKVTFRLLSR